MRIVSDRTLAQIGDLARGFILANIDSKTDESGKPFAPYSFGYWLVKKYKKKSGAKTPAGKARFLQTAIGAWNADKNNVTLAKTGLMRSSIMYKIDPSSDTIKFGFATSEDAEKAFYHIISGAGKGRVRRDFWYFSKQQENLIADKALELLTEDKQLRDYLRNSFE